MTPFEAVYGRLPPKLLSYVLGTTKVNAMDEVLKIRKFGLFTTKFTSCSAKNEKVCRFKKNLKNFGCWPIALSTKLFCHS
jgi:hypothetical protein